MNALIDDILSDMIFHGYKLKEENKKLTTKVFIRALFSPEFRLVLNYRLYSYAYRSGYKKLAVVLYMHTKLKYASDIHPKTQIGVPFRVAHHMGVVIGPEVKIGRFCYFMNNVTLGNKYVGEGDKMPIVGDNVILGVGSRVLGNINLGNHCVVGANSVILGDIPDNQIWAGAPAKFIKINDHG